ncbi:protein ENHANCED DOWNY MILDEW 2-like isoform X2 [Chenopodium quinoa]|uniref:protein ENHANCED DOWNY MILDEW 2-like isoform X2 n=1 Tax=Chenopodium quinoa TaxID=63459 RepID=UPI000B78E820|nr:protein ENHANCED DOWNY MILDEW 2-like isoform X2 [Chenopodium quinoa]
MASSDEEGEIFPESVTDYQFINQENKLVSFAFLPLLWPKEKPVDTVNLQLFFTGVSDDGLRKVFKQVVAWRYELSYVQPEISVFCKGDFWVKLLKPKKLFEPTIRSLLITIHCLHYVKHNVEATENSIWCHLSKVFSTYEVAPSEDDCMNHISLIRFAAERDKTLLNNEYMLGILLEKPKKGKVLQMEGLPVKRTDFIVDEEDDPFEVDDSIDYDDFFDTCCSLCDNGGDILSCEGRCMRSFHATEDSGEGLCESLGLSMAQVNAIPVFKCKNCRYQQHQCFICGKLGSSDLFCNPEVVPCIAANCGRFYHPSCVAKELQKRNDTQDDDLEKKIAAGESFACPVHKCFVCKHVEDREVDDLQFAVCRRCPKSYHRKCLPREISFEDDDENGILQRAWDGLLLKRILIYCMDHDIDPTLGTPLRNHILFPGKERKRVSENCLPKVNVLPKKRKLIPYHSPIETVERKIVKQADKAHCSSFKGSDATRQVGKGSIKPSSDAQKNSTFSNLTSASRRQVKFLPTLTTSKTVRDTSKFMFEKSLKSNVMKLGNANKFGRKLNTVHSAKPLLEKQCFSNPVDIQIEKRINALMENVNASFNEDEFKKQQVVPSNYKASQIPLDKTLSKVKVEVTVNAIRTALKKLEDGGTIEDAKTHCSAGLLCQLPIWKKRLNVYLAPFIHGMSYSSYGRHFTKPDKLQEIVERLHWYVQDGDMIVDFCCGANEFSCLMKKKLDDVGKKCYFKNFDLFPSKNDFNFERRDWFSVQSGELAEGSRLIMGLNPPFGVKASLANQFIDKALQFNPKLLIFIAPPETRRLDSGKGPTHTRYDLIWEDSYLLSGEAFYLPGSCDAREKQLSQWNNVTPPLYLWSHPDWTRKHREIAYRCGHSQISGQIPCSRPPTWNYILEEQQDCYGLPEANVCITPVDDLKDMDISPTNSPSYFIS